MADNERGFHGPGRQGHDHNKGGASGGEHQGGSKKGGGEPTNHGGHTYGGHAAHNARVESMRNAHAGHGQQDHERILHDTHKLHQNPGQHVSHGNKHGESSHYRGDGE